MEMLTCVMVVCRGNPRVEALTHVVALISDFLVDWCSLSLVRMVQRPNSLFLLKKLLAKRDEPAESDQEATTPPMPHFACNEVGQAMFYAITTAPEEYFQSQRPLDDNQTDVLLLTIQLLFEYSPRIPLDAPLLAPWHPMDAASAKGHFPIVQWFLQAHPSLCSRRALQEAASRNHLAIVQALSEHRDLLEDAQVACEKAAAGGHVAMVRFLCANTPVQCLECVLERALCFGHLQVVELLDELKRTIDSEPMTSGGDSTLSKTVCDEEFHFLDSASSVNLLASEKTYTHMKWQLVHHGGLPAFRWIAQRFPDMQFDKHFLLCACNSSDSEHTQSHGLVEFLFFRTKAGERRSILQELMDVSCGSGALECVQFLVSQGVVPLNLDKAIKSGRVELVRYLQQVPTKPVTEYSLKALRKAAWNGHLKMIEFLDPDGVEAFSEEALCRAAAKGDLALLKALLGNQNRGKAVHEALFVAVRSGQTDAVKYLFDKTKTTRRLRRQRDGVSLKSLMFALSTAAAMGHFEPVIYFLKEDDELFVGTNVNWERIIRKAIEKKRLDVIRLLHSRQVEGFTSYALDLAASTGHLNMVRFLHSHRDEGCSKDAMDNAAAGGYLRIVKFLHEHRKEGCSKRAMDDAAWHGHLHVVRFLHQNRAEGCTSRALSYAAGAGHLEILRFFFENRPQDAHARTAMASATEAGEFEVIKWLVENKRDTNEHYEMVLMLARITEGSCPNPSGKTRIIAYLEELLNASPTKRRRVE